MQVSWVIFHTPMIVIHHFPQAEDKGVCACDFEQLVLSMWTVFDN